MVHTSRSGGADHQAAGRKADDLADTRADDLLFLRTDLVSGAQFSKMNVDHRLSSLDADGFGEMHNVDRFATIVGNLNPALEIDAAIEHLGAEDAADRFPPCGRSVRQFLTFFVSNQACPVVQV
jgi:hypothetical protein